MGLDMYLFAREKADNLEPGIDPKVIKFGYWRKHRDLHRFIESKWREATGSEKEFNCIEFSLSKELCIEILQHATGRTLPEGDDGYFFGESTPKDHEDTIGFMHKALEYLDKGYEIIYDSWW